MNKIVYLESHSILIDLENILMIEKTEEKETREISLIYKDKHKIGLDYMNIKDNINEEKTIIQKDFDFLVQMLNCEWIKLSIVNEELEKREKREKEILEESERRQDVILKQFSVIEKVDIIINSKKNIFKKIKELKVIMNEYFKRKNNI